MGKMGTEKDSVAKQQAPEGGSAEKEDRQTTSSVLHRRQHNSTVTMT